MPIQQNSKVRSSNQQIQQINQQTQQQQQQQQQQLQKQQQQPKQYIERDFLKENIEYVKLKSLKVQRLKFTSSCPNESIPQIKPQLKTNLAYSGSGKGDAPRSVFERLAAGIDGSRITTYKKRLGAGGVIDTKLLPQQIKPLSTYAGGKLITTTTNKQQQQQQQQQQAIKLKNSIEAEGLEILEKKIDQMVQTFDELDDKFIEDAVIMEPTIFALKKIRDEREKQLQEQLKEKLLERRKFGKDSAKLEAHLNDLSEFLDTGSISRRKLSIEENKEKLKNVIYDRSFLKNLTESPAIKKPPSVNDGEDTVTVEKVSKIPLRTENNKINNSLGDGPKTNDDKLVVLYQRYKRDKRFFF